MFFPPINSVYFYISYMTFYFTLTTLILILNFNQTINGLIFHSEAEMCFF